MLIDRLVGWTPFRIEISAGGTMVDWCHLGIARCVEPFFYETIANAMRHPFNLAFQQRTRLQDLDPLPSGLPIAGFIFHMSRCGSTLVSQALAAFENNVVFAEAAPVRAVLRTHRGSRPEKAKTASDLKILINAYSQPRFNYEKRLFVKFMAADVLDIALVRAAFPDVPWIFITRDPAEILASHERGPGIDFARGQLSASRLDLDLSAIYEIDRLTYRARVVAALGKAAITAHEGGLGMIVDYDELPQALWSKILPHFGVSTNAPGLEVMRDVARNHAKDRSRPFHRDHDPNRADAHRFRGSTEPITAEIMKTLAELRAV